MNWDHLMVESAAKEGWRLVDTIDNGTAHVYVVVARAARTQFKDDAAAVSYVIESAKQNSPLHRHALQLMAASRIRTKKK